MDMMTDASGHGIRRIGDAGGPLLANSQLVPSPVSKMPNAQATSLKDAIRQGHTNIKDRLSIQLDFTNDKDDMRNGVITFDTIMYRSRLMDIPTIMETWKTTDGKNFYKTADVCQMLMVREEEDDPEEEDTTKKKRRDPNKVDKKYLWPHGYTPPLKNVRKRRFRKTLRKKNLDLPEIEKEVKRLLRTDSEAVSMKWEVVREEDEKKNNGDTNLTASNLDEQLFGEMLSSSDDEVGATINIIDEDDDSHLSVDDTHFSESYGQDGQDLSPNKPGSSGAGGSGTRLVTEFTPDMFNNEGELALSSTPAKASKSPGGLQGKDKLYARLSTLEDELVNLLSDRAKQEQEIAQLENMALKQRFLSNLANLQTQIREKEYEINEVRLELQE
ncbi:unnamed protein product, partial [Meganyctiphanes norvegica]